VGPDLGNGACPGVNIEDVVRRKVVQRQPRLAARLLEVEGRIHHPPLVCRLPSPAGQHCRQRRHDERQLPIRYVLCMAPARAHIVASGGRPQRHLPSSCT
jgi:hypothetical protein